jgi:hypothetical protein
MQQRRTGQQRRAKLRRKTMMSDGLPTGKPSDPEAVRSRDIDPCPHTDPCGDDTDPCRHTVTAWIAALTSRGVTLQARGTHIAYSPKSAYNGALTTDERAFAKERRQKSRNRWAQRRRYLKRAGALTAT